MEVRCTAAARAGSVTMYRRDQGTGSVKMPLSLFLMLEEARDVLVELLEDPWAGYLELRGIPYTLDITASMYSHPKKMTYERHTRCNNWWLIRVSFYHLQTIEAKIKSEQNNGHGRSPA